MHEPFRRALTVVIDRSPDKTQEVDFDRIGRASVMMRLPNRKKLADGNFLALTNLIESYGAAMIAKQERDC